MSDCSSPNLKLMSADLKVYLQLMSNCSSPNLKLKLMSADLIVSLQLKADRSLSPGSIHVKK
jgi:hypothetical protein